MQKWKKEEKEALRWAASKATSEEVDAKVLAERAGIPAGSVRQFITGGALGDERATALAAVLKQMGRYPSSAPSPGQPEAIQYLLDEMDTMWSVLRSDKKVPFRLVVVQSHLERMLAHVQAELEARPLRQAGAPGE